MLTEQEAFCLAIAAFPNDEFTMDCVDYKGCWSFPIVEKTDILTGRIVFVDKSTGAIMLGDPSFNVELWNTCPNHKNAIHDVSNLRAIMKALS